MRTAATASAARSSRTRTLAISLPSVVGEAVWPWVRESMGRAACSCASARRRAAICAIVGSRTSSRAARSISAWEVLLMSSDVQAKWMNSLTRASSASPATVSRRKYSTALTSWLVTRSMALIRAASASPKHSTTPRSRALPSGETGAKPGMPASDRAMSHSTSTRTRSRMKAASEAKARRAATLPAYRRSSGDSALGSKDRAAETVIGSDRGGQQANASTAGRPGAAACGLRAQGKAPQRGHAPEGSVLRLEGVGAGHGPENPVHRRLGLGVEQLARLQARIDRGERVHLAAAAPLHDVHRLELGRVAQAGRRDQFGERLQGVAVEVQHPDRLVLGIERL